MRASTIHPIVHAKKFIDFNGPNGCWIWTGSKTRRGYGNFGLRQIKHGRMAVRAHRFIYLFLTGQSGEGLVCDHLCRNTSCVNPHHIELVTSAENTRRGDTGIHQRQKTHCPSGHAYTLENTMINRDGSRRCRACNKIWCKKAWHAGVMDK